MRVQKQTNPLRSACPSRQRPCVSPVCSPCVPFSLTASTSRVYNLAMDSLSLCLAEYQRRQAFYSFPEGATDAQGLWFPSPEERRDCCEMPPSRAFPHHLQRHCRTLRHCAHLFQISEGKARTCWRDVRRGRLPNPLSNDELSALAAHKSAFLRSSRDKIQARRSKRLDKRSRPRAQHEESNLAKFLLQFP